MTPILKYNYTLNTEYIDIERVKLKGNKKETKINSKGKTLANILLGYCS